MSKFPIDTDDFLMDDEFNDFVLHENSKKTQWWGKYFKNNPETKSASEKARKIILGLSAFDDNVSLNEINEVDLNSKFEDTWKKYKESKSQRVVSQTSLFVWRAAVVAAVVILAVASYSALNNIFFDSDRNVVYSEVYVPAAKQSRITLSDGTVVWVNSETKIKYSNRFNSKDRNIYLDGEAYFEVAHNEKIPFKVFSKGTEVKVTGTKFNVRAYSDENRVETVLVEGKVQLSQSDTKTHRMIELTPGDKAVYNTETEKFSITRDGIDADVAWKEGKLIFRNTPLSEVCRKLEKWYDVEIILDDNTGSLKEHPFTFTVISETLPLVLEYLCEAAPLQYYTNYIDEDGEKGIEHIKYTILLKQQTR